MTYNPEIHDRRFPRLKNYDYSQPGTYFVTICIQDRKKMFGEIVEDAMHLSAIGETAQYLWKDMPNHFTGIELDLYVFMPNHFHGLVTFIDSSSSHDTKPARPLSQVVRTFKALTSRYVHAAGIPEFQWQQKHWDSIIRNQKHLDIVRQYIVNNPAKWTLDKLYL